MSEQLQLRRGSATQVAAFIGAQGEVVIDTTNNRAVVNDGATLGGWPGAKLAEVVTNTRTAVSDADYAVEASDRLVAYVALTAARVVSLPAASAYPTGTRLMVVDETGNCSSSASIAVNRAGADTIDGAASYVVNAGYAGVELESNGSNAWTILAPSPNLAVALVGIGTAPDPNNVLSAFGASALFNSADSFSLTINKSGAGNTASLIFEDGYSGRAQMGLNGSDNFSFKVSANGSVWTTAIALDATTGAPTFANQRTAVSDAAYSALVTDRVIAYAALTASHVVTLPAAAAYPSGQPLTIVDESGNCSVARTITVAAAGSDAINGLTSAAINAAFGAVVLESNGATGWTVVKRAGGVNVSTFSSSGTYAPTPGMRLCDVYLLGGGGGGGGGALQAASTACSGGAGGGGGAIVLQRFPAAQIGASTSVTIGAGGAGGGSAATSTTAGSAGSQGSASSFGSTLMRAYGGGGGAGGQLGAASGGGAGASASGNGTSGAGSTAGGATLGSGAGGSGAAAGGPNNPVAGAGGGGGGATGVAFTGGTAWGGGAGGGAGGGVTAANATNSGNAAGNQVATSTTISGGLGGAANANGGAGGGPSSLTFATLAGSGGGGGGSGISGAAGAGGSGGLGAGGGGGGSMTNGGTPGAGGVGGAGFCCVVEYF